MSSKSNKKKNRTPAIAGSLGILIVAMLVFGNSKTEFDIPQKGKQAKFKETYELETPELFLTDKPSDFIKFGNGFAIGERTRSTLLLLDKNLKPIKRIGTKGDGPKEFNQIGSLQQVGDNIAVFDRGHSRIVVLDKEGDFQEVFKSDRLNQSCHNINLTEDKKLIFAISDPYEPLQEIDLNTGEEKSFKFTKIDVENPHYQKHGTPGFMFDYDDQHFYFPPAQTKVEVFDKDFSKVSELPLDLDIWKTSRRRAANLYKSSKNTTMLYYTDVVRDKNRFYLLAFEDYLQDGKYKRSLNKVVELYYNKRKKELSVGDVLELEDEGYYKQLLVEKDQLYAWNLKSFQVDRYEIVK